MAVTNTPIFPQGLVSTGCALAHGTGLVQFCAAGTATGTMSPLFAAGPNGSLLSAIMVQNTDTATCTAVLILSTGGAAGTFVQVLGVAAISGASQGTAYGNPPTNLLNGTQGVANLPYDSCGNRVLAVAAGNTLNIGLLSTIINGSGLLYATVQGGNF